MNGVVVKSPHFHKYYMNLFKKKKEEPKVFEGRFITDDEIKMMIKSDKPSFISKEMKEINDMVEKMKNYGR